MPGDDDDDDFDAYDEFDLDDEWWVIEVADGGVAIEMPTAALDRVNRLLATPAAGIPVRELEVDFDDEGTRRSLGADELLALIEEARAACVAALEAGATLDDPGLLVLAQSAGMLSALAATAAGTDTLDELAILSWHCERALTARIRPRRDGTFRLRWRPLDRAVVDDAAADLRRLLSSDDPTVSRLFPSAYGSDDERNAGWDVLMRGELIERRVQALDVLADLMQRSECTVDELGSAMRAINDARLVLGTRLDVDESGDPSHVDPADRADYALYEHLGMLLTHTVRALRTSL